FAHGRGHARLRFRRTAKFAAVVPDQGDRGARRPRGADAGAAGLGGSLSAIGCEPRAFSVPALSGQTAHGGAYASRAAGARSFFLDRRVGWHNCIPAGTNRRGEGAARKPPLPSDRDVL